MKPVRVAMIVFIVIFVGLVVAGVIPLSVSTSYRCWDCGARGGEGRILLVPLPMHVTEGSLCRYWRKSVDPSHNHRWARIFSNSMMPLGGLHTDYTAGSHHRWLLDDGCVIAILKSLPDSKAQKKFMANLTNNSDKLSRKDYEDLHNSAWTLRLAYEENPKRTDWTSVIRKVGRISPHAKNGKARLKADR